MRSVWPSGGDVATDLRADVPARARAVLDDDRLPPELLQGRLHDARERVGAAAGGKRHDDVHGLRGKWLGRGAPGHACERGEHGRETRIMSAR
jgi:hypothetical protein